MILRLHRSNPDLSCSFNTYSLAHSMKIRPHRLIPASYPLFIICIVSIDRHLYTSRAHRCRKPCFDKSHAMYIVKFSAFNPLFVGSIVDNNRLEHRRLHCYYNATLGVIWAMHEFSSIYSRRFCRQTGECMRHCYSLLQQVKCRSGQHCTSR